MRLSLIGYSLVIIMGVVATFAVIFADVQDRYDLPVSQASLGTFNKFSEVKNLSDEISNSVQSPSGSTSTDTLGGFLGAALSTFRLMFASTGIVASLITGIANFFNIPVIWAHIGLIMFILGLVWAFVSFINRWFV